MLDKINLKNVLVLDIETVPEYPHMRICPKTGKNSGQRKCSVKLKTAVLRRIYITARESTQSSEK